VSSLGKLGEDHGTCEDLGLQHGRTSRSKGSGMLRESLTELGRPSFALPNGEVKQTSISRQGEVTDGKEGVGGGHSTDDT
jgi:hypothetical protein